MIKNKKVLFIVLDGIDGCGSTTHVKLLKKWFEDQKLKIITTHEPTESNIGKIIKEYLKSNKGFPELDALLFASDRAEHTKQIESWLKLEFNVISDRYIESSMAYQGGQGLSNDWIKTINKVVIEPDIYIILDIDPQISIDRFIKERKYLEKFENVEFLKEVRAIFLNRAKQNKYEIVSTEGSIEEVHEKIKKIIKTKLF